MPIEFQSGFSPAGEEGKELKEKYFNIWYLPPRYSQYANTARIRKPYEVNISLTDTNILEGQIKECRTGGCLRAQKKEEKTPHNEEMRISISMNCVKVLERISHQ